MLIEFLEYMPALVDVIKKKSEYKMVEILAKSKTQNLFKFRFWNLSKFERLEIINTIGKLKFITSNTRVIFNKFS